MYTLVHTSHFDRQLARFRRAHPELRRRVSGVLRDLEADPFQPRLRLHSLKGQLQGLCAVSITYEYRLILTLRITEREIVLVNIGTHNEVYR